MVMAAVILFLTHSLSNAAEWFTDFEAAKKKAADENKFLLINFTGSDWCGFCIKLEKNVFSQEDFQTGIKDKFVLVELDFPRKPENKSKLSEATITQNNTLQKTYAVKGAFPTIILTDAQGKPFAKTGFLPIGGRTYVKHLDELLAMRETAQSAFAEAKDKEGKEKANTLLYAIGSMGLNDELIATFYPDELEAIKESSPDAAKSMEMKKSLMEFQNQLNALAAKKDHEGMIKLIDEKLATGEFDGEVKQQTMIFKAISFIQLKKPQEALQVLDEAKAISPKSRFAAQIDGIKQKINAAAAE